MIYYKAALRAALILFLLFAVITAILVICCSLPSLISRKIGRGALADPEAGIAQSGRRRRTRMENIEWIRFYPLKKLILVLLWLFCAVVSARAFQVYILAGMLVAWDGKDIGFALFFCLLTAVTFVPVIRYVLLPYHSMPCLNRILSRKEMDGLMEREYFRRVRFSDEDLDRYHPFYRSTNWLVVDGKAISKKLAAIARVRYSLAYDRFTRLWLEVYYLNGQKITVDLGQCRRGSWEREKRKELAKFLAEEGIRVDEPGWTGSKEKLQDRLAGEYAGLLPEFQTESEKILYFLKNDTAEIKKHIL